MAFESPGHTLQPTALVHEAYLRLVGKGEKSLWDNPGHVFAAAAESIHRVLIEKARRRQIKKRGGEHRRRELKPLELACSEPSAELLALNEALGKREATHPRLAELVKLRSFVGRTVKQAARVIGISRRSSPSVRCF